MDEKQAKRAEKEALKAAKLAEKEAKVAEKEAQATAKAALKAEKLAAKEALKAEKQAAKEALQAEKQAAKEAKLAQQQADREAKAAEKLAAKEAKQAAKEAKRAAKPARNWRWFGWFRSAPEEQASEQPALLEETSAAADSIDTEDQPSAATSALADTEVTPANLDPTAIVPPIDPPATYKNVAVGEPATDIETPEQAKMGLFGRIRQGLSRTSERFTDGLSNVFLGKKEIDDELLEELETQLLMADVGLEATNEIIENLTNRVKRKQLADPEALYPVLQEELCNLLEPSENPLTIETTKAPFVIMMVGVNGVGKTTTIGKLAKRYQNEGKSVMLAAGDTFRAAAVEQLQVWGDRNQVPVIAQHTGADSASVLFDAIESAKARQVDVLIADTAGRLHTKSNLMEELKKIGRVMQKVDASAPHEVLLVLDAGTGQNALNQAKQFREAIGVTGIALTKLDGTAKGGIIFAISKEMGLPIRFIGVGEQIEDLRPFDAQEFVSALFNRS